MPTGKLAKWQILLSEFDIVYITQKAMKGQALANHLAENQVDGDYEPLTTYFPDEKVLFAGEDITETYPGRFRFADTPSPRRMVHQNVKILPYLHCVKELCKKFTKIEFKNVPRIQNEFVDALATLSSMIQHPDKNYIDPIEIEIRDQHAYCFHVDEEPDGKP
ncbi:uncharacterized protein [Nicotiana tomentosiformis]|uniref:uncharacterized protein n=1 Tax=Nicotiana tomentosiformis TaxID=4098 RepID=UPI00388CE7E8